MTEDDRFTVIVTAPNGLVRPFGASPSELVMDLAYRARRQFTIEGAVPWTGHYYLVSPPHPLDMSKTLSDAGIGWWSQLNLRAESIPFGG